MSKEKTKVNKETEKEEKLLLENLLLLQAEYEAYKLVAKQHEDAVLEYEKAYKVFEEKNKKNIEVFNLGTGKGSSVLEILNGFESATGVKVPYEIVERRTGDIEKVWADTTFANQELGWKAEIPLEESLLSAWNWQKKLQ